MGAAGASCGVNQAVQLARRHPEVRTVVLLSGGLTANGREFIRDSAWLPIFGAASQGDGGAVETMRFAMGWSRNPTNTFVEYQAAGHGTDMFAVEKELQPQVLTWLETYLRDAPATRPTEATSGGPTIVEQFWTTLNQPGGVERARQLYDEAKSRDKSVVLFPEPETNLLGYALLQDGKRQGRGRRLSIERRGVSALGERLRQSVRRLSCDGQQGRGPEVRAEDDRDAGPRIPMPRRSSSSACARAPNRRSKSCRPSASERPSCATMTSNVRSGGRGCDVSRTPGRSPDRDAGKDGQRQEPGIGDRPRRQQPRTERHPQD